MFIDKDKNKKYTLGDLITCIGSLVKEYEDNIISENNTTSIDNRLLKTKDAIKEFPLLTQYTIAKAVQDGKLSFTKVGNTNYFRVQDIENFINSGRKN